MNTRFDLECRLQEIKRTAAGLPEPDGSIAEINGRIEEIQSCAASWPRGGDIENLRVELVRLANWTNQTLMFLGKIL